MSYIDEATNRLRRPDFERWMDQASSTGFCAQPVRLVGSTSTFDARTGDQLAHYCSSNEPDGVTYVRCGNRRAVRCPSCSYEYKADMWHLVVAGAAGGSKGVPNSVATHPLVFATLTAPSFGAVHAARTSSHGAARCRPRARRLCPHGRPTWCMATHDPDSPAVGEPICMDCYDYETHIAWQWHAPELWRRFVIRLRRELAASLGVCETAARKLVRVQFAKVAEFQRRGAVHFHALIRLDGDGSDADPFPAPLVPTTAADLAALIQKAAAAVEVIAGPLPGEHTSRRLVWGRQCDARPVYRHVETEDGRLTDRAVAAYIAKYATKATEDLATTSSGSARPHISTIRRLVAEAGRAAALDDLSPYRLLGRWESMLGFRGHFSTKSRRYSTTLGRLRSARRDWQRKQARPPVAADQNTDDSEETTLVVGSWSFVGMGWLTAGDTALAAESAAAAREWRSNRHSANRTNNEER
ncbi:replication initiator [Agromyces sp. NPDC058136]|uniref:replication initiator n=1 Tax=Agromyces sp. NPDC058136 TaxID=3346354 RepID=UPI0036D9F666